MIILITFAFCKKKGTEITGLKLIGILIDNITSLDVTRESWELIIVLDIFLNGLFSDSFGSCSSLFINHFAITSDLKIINTLTIMNLPI